MQDDARQRLATWLSSELCRTVEVVSVTRLSGGAIQENWLVRISADGVEREIVIRKNATASIASSHTRAHEFTLIKVAAAAGVKVPEPIAFCADSSVLGSPFAVMAKVEGIGFGPKIVKDPALEGNRQALVREIGRQMALIHAITPPHQDLAFLGVAPTNPLAHEITLMRHALDDLGIARPALEWGLLALSEINFPAARITLVHRDFRTGNFMLNGHELTAVLDWEFAAWGDPMADLGWFCAQCWRFSRRDLEAGGLGSRSDLYAGYEAASSITVDHRAVLIWEIMAHIRWAVVALQQGARHLTGQEPSLEHALTGRIATELELAVLKLTAPDQLEKLGQLENM